jgi:hypothetical protein
MSGGRRFARAASALLEEHHGVVPEGNFVCPLCLMLRPESKATAAHYPGRTLAGIHVTTLACEACNALMGSTYEPEAVDRMSGLRTIAMRFPDMGWLIARGTVEDRPDGLFIGLNPPTVRPKKDGRFSRAWEAMRARSNEPDEIEVEVRRASDDSIKRAMVAWSLLAWAHYARYVYTATEGAYRVRQMVLTPEAQLPPSILVMHGDLWPLDPPQPVLVVRADRPPNSLEDVDEFIGLGIDWGRSYVLLPFANDEDGRCWQRLMDLRQSEPKAIVRRWKLREFISTGLLRRELRHSMVITGGSERHVLTKVPDDADALAFGESPLRIEPARGKWRPNQTVEARTWVRASDDFRLRP